MCRKSQIEPLTSPVTLLSISSIHCSILHFDIIQLVVLLPWLYQWLYTEYLQALHIVVTGIHLEGGGGGGGGAMGFPPPPKLPNIIGIIHAY